jgi:hypothetical protein
LDDLAGLSFQSSPLQFGQGGSITLGSDTSTPFPFKFTIGMFSSSPSNTPGRVASPAFQQSPINKPSTPDYSAFSSLQQSLSSSRSTSQLPQSTYSYNPPVTRHTPNASIDDDFGTFTSAVQDSSINSVILSNSSNLKITLEAARSGQTTIVLTARFSNNISTRIDEITFQMAIPRVSSPVKCILLICSL